MHSSWEMRPGCLRLRGRHLALLQDQHPNANLGGAESILSVDPDTTVPRGDSLHAHSGEWSLGPVSAAGPRMHMVKCLVGGD